MNAVTLMEIERSLRRNVEERARLEAALDVDADVLERIVPVVADVLVELAVLLFRDLVLAACPDRLHRVERVAAEADRIRDEVGVPLDDLLQDGRVRVVLEPVLFLLRFEMECDGRSGGLALRGGERVAVAARLPPRRRGL